MRKLRRIRAEKGLTMDALEERTGVSKRTISEIERGMRNPQPLTLAKLASALDVNLEELLEDETPKASTAPLSFELWLELRCGHSYLAKSEEEIDALFGSLSSDEESQNLFRQIHEEYIATTRTRKLPPEERILVRGHHKEALSRWLTALSASGNVVTFTDEAERSIREAIEARADEAG